MRARMYVALFFFVCTLAWSAYPSSARAFPQPFIDDVLFIGLPAISNAPYGTYQTALKTGDTYTLQVNVHSIYALPPTVSTDLSQLGVSGPTSTPAGFGGTPNHHSLNYTDYFPNYFYDFGPFIIGADIVDGLKTIPITATDLNGGVAEATAQIVIDNAPPTISLSSITFSTTTPGTGDFMYLTGSVSGTGSAMKVREVTEGLFDANGNSLPGSFHDDMMAYDPQPITTAVVSSAGGTFTNIPVQLFEFDVGQIVRATSFRIRISAYDEAGNFASTSLTVPVPRPTPPDPCAVPGACASNVLFLPGIEGSRLYEGTGCGKAAEEKLWEPLGESIIKILRGAGDDKVGSLFLDQTGESVCSDIYTKENDILSSAGGNDIYQSFIDEMNGLKANGTITDWKPVAYDWRLSLTNLLNKGTGRDGKIYYEEATSTPYIEQTLRALAGNSKTGKVSIVAHSNGGLVAKALLNQLGGSTATSLVDKVIMVGAPQSGAPVDIGALLYGYDQGISSHGIPILHSAVARELAQNSPMAYHLLPSEDYLESTAGDSMHPVARFAGDAYAEEISAYGTTIANRVALDDFLLASSLNSALIEYANSTHAALDFWTPPEGIEVSQIAGWGADTVAGIDFYTPPPINALTVLEPMRAYRPIFTEDGDGVVPTPSALMMASSTNVKRYWVDLHSYNKTSSIDRGHKDLFEISSLEDFIKNIIKNSTSTLPVYISTSQPPPVTETKKLTFFLHSPLTLRLTDSSGNTTGLAEDNSISQDIPDSTYGEFGDVKYITVPQGSQYELTLHGQESGTFSLDIQESSGGVIIVSSTIANVPTTENTLATLTISGGIDTASALTVDENGDGEDIIAITPQVGETVNYEPPAPEPAPESESAPEPPLPTQASSGGGRRGGGVSVFAAVPAPAAITTTASTFAAITEPIATNAFVTTIPSSRPPVATRSISKRLPPAATVANTMPDFSQTASVYGASQQPALQKLGAVVYNNLHRVWVGLKIIFLIQK